MTSSSSFYERPILNSPYAPPSLHHPLDKNGQPLDSEPKAGRRPSRFIVPVPASRKKASAGQSSLDLETYTENALINEIRGYLEPWRNLRNPADWGVTFVSQRLLEHWRRDQWAGPRPFFCQVEAVETIIWLTEVAPKKAATRGLLDQIANYNKDANPALFRLAMKMAMACDEGVLPLDERVSDAADEAELDDIYETERRLLYVACTRAREHLLATGISPGSEYLADLAPGGA